MTKQEFMYRLAQQLLSLPPEERVCALTFYDEYFADAGEENVQQVIQELGSPEEVARTIKEDFAQRNPGYDPNSPQQTATTPIPPSSPTAPGPSTSRAGGARPTPPTPGSPGPSRKTRAGAPRSTKRGCPPGASSSL